MRERMSFVEKWLALALVGIFCTMISFQGVMAAEKFPEKPIKIIVGFSAGGTVDLGSRMLGSPHE